MQITKVSCWRENLKLTKPYTIAYQTIEYVENVFVYLELENGQIGIGAGSPAAFVTGETVEDSLQALEEQARTQLLGKDIRHFQLLLKRMEGLLSGRPAAMAAIDLALHDAFARFIGTPLCDLFGRMHHGFPTSVTIGIMPIEETLREANHFLEQGFKVLKIKTGKSVEEDIATFRRLREELGWRVHLRVDANQGYTVDDLNTFARGAEEHRVEFYEQPLPYGRPEAMLQLPVGLRRLCAADEDLKSVNDALRLAATPHPYGIFNIKLMKCGGLRPALQIADIAQRSGIELMWGCNDESIVSITAALHAALACPATRYIDLDGSFDLAHDIAQGGFELHDGYLIPNGAPGLGVHLFEKPTI